MSDRVERALSFLEIWTVVKSDGSISTKVFKKETNMDQYLNFSSNHLLEHKRVVMRTLMKRSDRLVSDESELGKEKEHIRSGCWWLHRCLISRTRNRKRGGVERGGRGEEKWSSECQQPPLCLKLHYTSG